MRALNTSRTAEREERTVRFSTCCSWSVSSIIGARRKILPPEVVGGRRITLFDLIA